MRAVRACFVVNPDSGGRQGARVLAWLAARGHSVVDVRQVRLGALVRRWDGVLVACGGDGTASAVLAAVAEAGRALPVAILPLGTGNDLARCLGWAPPPPGTTGLERWLAHAIAARERRLDTWLLHGPGVRRRWCNYWSLGYDAAVTRRFHALRRRCPLLVRGRLAGRAGYAACGLLTRRGGLRAACPMLPAGAASLVLANIASYAGGLRLAPGIRADDGLCDLFLLPGGWQLATVLAGWRVARGLGQRRHWAVRLRRPLAMQLDGEPFVGRAGIWRVEPAGAVRVLLGPGAGAVAAATAGDGMPV